MPKSSSKCPATDINANVKAKEDPYQLKEYQSDFVPKDGGQAPLPKTLEPETYHDNRLYVSNIPFAFTDNDLKDLFSRFGRVSSAMIVSNERGSKGFGFVTLDSVENCERARHTLHGTKILGRTIEVRKATPLARPPAPKQRGPSSVSSSCVSSPHRTPSRTQFKKKPLPTNPTVAVNPHIRRSSTLGIGQPATIQAQCRMPPPPVPIGITNQFGNMINPRNNELNALFGENAIFLQNLSPPLQFSSQLRAPFQATMAPTFYAAPFYPGTFQQATLFPCGLPPLQQTQEGFPYKVAAIPPQYVTVRDTGLVVGPGSCYFGQKQFSQGVSSLNNTLLNSSILSTSMNASTYAHMQGMQDQLVDLLNLDGTMNRSKVLDLRDSKECSLNASSSSDVSDSSRKRRNLAIVDEGSPRKMSKIH